MRYRKLSPTGDYIFGNGPLDFYVNSPAAVGQLVQTNLELWLGEWYLNTLDGTPYMQGVLGKHSKDTADATIQQQILNTAGVTDLSSYESILDPITRKFSVIATIDTIYGTTTVQLENYANY